MALYKKGNLEDRTRRKADSVFSGFFYMAVDENYVEEYTGRMIDAQNQQLDLLKCDLAAWLNRTLGICCLNEENLLRELDNGSLLCRLAKTIREKAKLAIANGLTNRPLPKMNEKYFENAMSRSFFSRDNMESFIRFCRSIGVHQNLLFESDDLVLHNRPRSVIICLLEVARLATYYGVEPPNLLALEKATLEEERNFKPSIGISSQVSWQFQSLPSHFDCKSLKRYSPCLSTTEPVAYKRWSARHTIPYENREGVAEEINCSSLPHITSSELSCTEVDQCSKSSKDDSYTTCFETKLVNESDKTFDELDKKVAQAAQLLHLNCRCANRKYMKLKIRKIGVGKYTIAGRNVFVRLLKSRHMMVRVGGGWDSLDHFLQRHDPCQVDGKELRPRPIAGSLAPNISKRHTYYSTFKKLLRPGESAI